LTNNFTLSYRHIQFQLKASLIRFTDINAIIMREREQQRRPVNDWVPIEKTGYRRDMQNKKDDVKMTLIKDGTRCI